MGLYEQIKDIAKSKGYSINRLEKELGFARSSINKFNTNKPSIEKIQQIADLLNVSVDTITGEEKDITLLVDGLTGFQAILADIYNSCEMESVSGKFAECLYFSIGSGAERYALEESDFDRLYNTVKQTIKQMTDLLAKDERIVRRECQKAADQIPTLEDYIHIRNKGIIIDELEDLYGFGTCLNAAHTRTDISVTDEYIRHDDSIMEDENF